MILDIIRREELEAREAEWLAPYAMPTRETQGRVHAEPEHEFRTAFQRDRERVIHSRAFRRLQYKTQVFVNHEGDYYRTRLTHTLEAAQIARTVARALRLNEDLAEAITLAHDIGHPPFGHAGERALRALMSQHGGFEHNAQALRLVDLLERRYAAHRGLNLSYEVREGLWKRRDTETSRALGYDRVFDRDAGPLLEAQVADWADGIAYDHHDLDDALKAGLIRRDDLSGLEQWQEAEEEVERHFAEVGERADRAERVRRQEIVRRLLGRQAQDLIDTTRARLDAAGIGGLKDVRDYPRRRAEQLERLETSDADAGPDRAAPDRGSGPSQPPQTLVGLSERSQRHKQELQRFLFARVYRNYRVQRQMDKGKRVITDLFEEYRRSPHLLPEEYQEWVQQAGLERGVCDYVSGMTDRYAQREHQKLFALFEPM